MIRGVVQAIGPVAASARTSARDVLDPNGPAVSKMTSPNAQEILQEIAAHRGSKVLLCQDFDPNVCTFTQDRNKAALTASSGQPFLRKTAFTIGERRVRLSANDTALRITLLVDLEDEPLSLNRTDKIQALKPAGEIVLGGRRYPVSTRSGSALSPHGGILHNPEFLRFLEIASLGKEESLHIYRNAVTLYLFSPSTERVAQIVLSGTAFLSSLATGPRKIDLDGLPADFRPLLPLLQTWGTIDEEEREERRQGVPRPALEAVIEQVKPYLPAIDSYLREFGNAPLTEAAISLGALAEFVVETELYLKQSI